MGLNDAKTVFTSFFNIDAMAKTESICLGEENHNIGTCKQNADASTGSSCVKAGLFDSKNCFGTNSYEFK